MIAASAIRAMRRALEKVEGLNERPAEIRSFFAPAAASVRLAAEIAVSGGVTYLPAHPSDALFDLLSSGWIRGVLRHGAEMRMDEGLLAAFASEGGGS